MDLNLVAFGGRVALPPSEAAASNRAAAQLKGLQTRRAQLHWLACVLPDSAVPPPGHAVHEAPSP